MRGLAALLGSDTSSVREEPCTRTATPARTRHRGVQAHYVTSALPPRLSSTISCEKVKREAELTVGCGGPGGGGAVARLALATLRLAPRRLLLGLQGRRLGRLGRLGLVRLARGQLGRPLVALVLLLQRRRVLDLT